MSPNPIARSTPRSASNHSARPTWPLHQRPLLLYTPLHPETTSQTWPSLLSLAWCVRRTTDAATLTFAAQEAPHFRHLHGVCVESKRRRFNSSHPAQITNTTQSRSRLRRRLRLLVSLAQLVSWCAVCMRQYCSAPAVCKVALKSCASGRVGDVCTATPRTRATAVWTSTDIS